MLTVEEVAVSVTVALAVFGSLGSAGWWVVSKINLLDKQVAVGDTQFEALKELITERFDELGPRVERIEQRVLNWDFYENRRYN